MHYLISDVVSLGFWIPVELHSHIKKKVGGGGSNYEVCEFRVIEIKRFLFKMLNYKTKFNSENQPTISPCIKLTI